MEFLGHSLLNTTAWCIGASVTDLQITECFSNVGSALAIECDLGIADLLATRVAREHEDSAAVTKLNNDLARDLIDTLAVLDLVRAGTEIHSVEVEADARKFEDTCCRSVET